eukprot:Sdes_comp17398_c0_seq1m6608
MSEKLRTLFEQDWQWELASNPEFATLSGSPSHFSHLLNDRSLKSFEEKKIHCEKMLEELHSIPLSSLQTDSDCLNYSLFEYRHQCFLRGYPFKTFLMPCSLLEGPHTELFQIMEAISFEKFEDYKNFIARIFAVPFWITQIIDLMKLGIENHITVPKICLHNVDENIQKYKSDSYEKSLFFTPFQNFPPSFTSVQKNSLLTEFQEAVELHLTPSLDSFLTFFNNEYLPKCRDSISCLDYPHGEDLYKECLSFHTSTKLTPSEIHDVGLSEVNRIQAEILKIMTQLNFSGSLAEFYETLQTDPKYHFKSEEDMLNQYRSFCKQIDPTLPKLFKTLPRTPYGVIPTPQGFAKGAPPAYYSPCTLDGKKPGWMYVNTLDIEARRTYEMVPLCLHEAVPGHHLQTALVAEMKDIPKFRTLIEDRRYFEAPGRYPLFSSYVEGWGLYSEGLGEELGFYQCLNAKLGRLTYDMLRSCRLVCDTGIHSLRWTYEEAVSFLTQYSALDQVTIHQEVKRYIAWPGQACAYKIGEIEIKRLRELASSSLGQNFDIRDFHQVILDCGPVPLFLLEDIVKAYILSTSQNF